MRFVWWHVVVDFAKYTTEEMLAVYRRLHESIDVLRSGMTRERICVSHVRTLFPLTIANEVKTVFGLANRTEKVSSTTFIKKLILFSQAEEMLNAIKSEFENLVIAANWLDHNTKFINIDKSRSISAFIGYQKPILDPDILDDHYKNVSVSCVLYSATTRHFSLK